MIDDLPSMIDDKHDDKPDDLPNYKNGDWKIYPLVIYNRYGNHGPCLDEKNDDIGSF
jgi:hypothetical protein